MQSNLNLTRSKVGEFGYTAQAFSAAASIRSGSVSYLRFARYFKELQLRLVLTQFPTNIPTPGAFNSYSTKLGFHKETFEIGTKPFSDQSSTLSI